MASLQFSCCVTGALRSKRSAPVYVTIDLDVWRHIVFEKGLTSEHRGHNLYEKDDFHKFKYLPVNWWYNLDGDGNGISVDFPLKAKPMLSWSPKNFLKEDGGMIEAKRFPIEKVCLTYIILQLYNNYVCFHGWGHVGGVTAFNERKSLIHSFC